MNNSQIATAVVMRDLNCYSLETIGHRILLQKKIYLVQDIGLPLGYGYGWYIHGPYSTDLTTVAYQIIPEGVKYIENHKLKKQYATMVDRVNSLENDIVNKNLKIGVVQWYELLASLAYWTNFGYDTEEKVTQKIKETKPQFSQEQIKAAFDSYNEFKSSV